MRRRTRRWWVAGASLLLVALPPIAPASASESGVELSFSPEVTDFGLVAVGATATRVIDVLNAGDAGATLDVFIQQDREQFTAPATIEIAPGGSAVLEVSYTPVRVGQATTDIVLFTGPDAWATSVVGMAADPAADDPEDAVDIVAGEGETFYYATTTVWATTSAIEADCGIANGVWLKYTASFDAVVTFIGGPVCEIRDGQIVSSGGGWVPFTVLEGKTLYLVTGTGGEPGWLDTFARVQPLPHIVLEVSPKATVDKNGALTITGTGRNEPDGDVYLSIAVRQKTGHGAVVAAAGPNAYRMTSQKSVWSFTLSPDSGKFTAGPIQVHVEGTSPSGPAYGGTVLDTSVKASVSK